MLNNIKYSPSFSARNKEIRTADAIERKTKAEFPMLSQTYIDSFYRSRDKGPVVSKQLQMQSKIKEMRRIAANPEAYGHKVSSPFERNTLYPNNLNAIKSLKMGNCRENAMAAVAVLLANGYYNSERTLLMYKVDFVNKETGELESSGLYPLDHSFAVSDMNRGGKKDIVIDPWLGFADSKSGAIARFKQIYSEEDYKEAISILRGLFCADKMITYDEFAQKYDTKTGFYFMPAENDLEEFQKFALGQYARAKFKGILLDTQG